MGRLKSLLKIAFGSRDSVLWDTLFAILLRAMGALLAFAFNVAVGRILGAEGTGVYFLALSVATIGAVVAKMGLDNSLLRFIAAHASKDEWGRVKGVFRLGMRMAGAASLVCTFIIVGFAPYIANTIFQEPNLTGPLRVMGLALFTFAMMTLLSECLKGLRQIRISMLVSGVLYPFFALLVVWPLASLYGAAGAAGAYVFGTGLAAFIGWVFWRRDERRHEIVTEAFAFATLWSSCRPLWVLSIISRAILPWAPLFLLGIWGTAQDSGIFGAATRISLLATFFLASVNTVVAPRFAALHANGDIEGLAKLARQFVILVTLMTSPVFIILIFGSTWVMSMFGPDFVVGGPVLLVLACGQFFNALTGPVSLILTMSGHEAEARNCGYVSLAVMVVLSPILIPLYGPIGAAIVASASLFAINVMPVWYVWRRLGFIVLPFAPKMRTCGN